MKFLLDQDVYAATARFLSSLGHDVVPVACVGLSQADDLALLRVAQEQGRIFVTRDRDFGGLVFVGQLGVGVIYLRILPSTQRAVHSELERVLCSYSEDELMVAFVVVEPGLGARDGRGPAAMPSAVVLVDGIGPGQAGPAATERQCMAALNEAGFPHWEAVRPPLPALLRHIGQQPVAQRFYLAGGTALALQLIDQARALSRRWLTEEQ